MLTRRTFLQTAAIGAAAGRILGTSAAADAASSAAQAQAAQKPNILFVLMDNLGYGEVGAYGGGVLRGAPTPRIDRLATEGTRLTNFNVEAQCTPSRSAILTGRFAIRSGTHSVPMPGSLDGLTQWEVTLAETLSAAGYATAAFGKWHLGSSQGRLPNAQGFDEWYGIPRTTDESMFPSQPGAKAAGIPFMHTMEGRKGEQSRDLVVYDLDERRRIDGEVVRRTIDFMDRAIDGVDQSAFLLGRSERSAREGFLVFVADRMEAIKWKNFKMAFYEQERDWWSPPTKLGVPKIFDLLSDPKEEYGATLTPTAWVGGPMMKIVAEFEASLKTYPPISPGTPDPYRP